jgi:hypothetical protein
MSGSTQSVQIHNNQEDVAIFLIDVSGSMVTKLDQAENRVSEKIEELQDRSPNVWVSRTYIGGSNGGRCGDNVLIAPAVPIQQSRPQAISANGSTQLGTALRSALTSSNSAPDKVYIVSDLSETPNCGEDLCTAAQKLSGLGDTVVEVIPILAEPEHIDRAGCLLGSQLRISQSSVDFGSLNSGPLSVQSDQGSAARSPPENLWKEGTWLEKWFWLILFAFFAACAILLARRYGSKAREYELEIERLQSKHQSTAPENEAEGKQVQNEDGIFRPSETPGLLHAARILGALGVIGVLCLMFAPPIPWMDFQAARDLSWIVLSSNFANAFAIIEVTPILFAGAQMWRFEQAKRTYYLVSDSAAIEEKKREQEKLKQEFSEYQKLRSSLERITFASPWPLSPFRSQPIRANEEDKQNFKSVSELAVALAQGEEITDYREKKVALEIERLRQHAKSFSFFSRNLADFVEKLIEDKVIVEGQEQWINLAGAVKRRNPRDLRASIKAIIDSQDSEKTSAK